MRDLMHDELNQRTIFVERSFDLTADVLFNMHSNCADLKKWFGPADWTLSLCEIDFRVGGRFKFAFSDPQGIEGPAFGGTYLEIVPNRLIRYDNGFDLPGADKMEVTTSFDEQGGITTISVTSLFDSAASCESFKDMGHPKGIASGLDKLGKLLGAHPSSGGS